MSTIPELIERGIALIDKDLALLESQEGPLDKLQYDKLTEYLRTLVAIVKDQRTETKEKQTTAKELTDAELEAAIIAEADKLKGAHGL